MTKDQKIGMGIIVFFFLCLYIGMGIGTGFLFATFAYIVTFAVTGVILIATGLWCDSLTLADLTEPVKILRRLKCFVIAEDVQETSHEKKP